MKNTNAIETNEYFNETPFRDESYSDSAAWSEVSPIKPPENMFGETDFMVPDRETIIKALAIVSAEMGNVYELPVPTCHMVTSMCSMMSMEVRPGSDARWANTCDINEYFNLIGLENMPMSERRPHELLIIVVGVAGNIKWSTCNEEHDIDYKAIHCF